MCFFLLSWVECSLVCCFISVKGNFLVFYLFGGGVSVGMCCVVLCGLIFGGGVVMMFFFVFYCCGCLMDGVVDVGIGIIMIDVGDCCIDVGIGWVIVGF